MALSERECVDTAVPISNIIHDPPAVCYEGIQKTMHFHVSCTFESLFTRSRSRSSLLQVKLGWFLHSSPLLAINYFLCGTVFVWMAVGMSTPMHTLTALLTGLGELSSFPGNIPDCKALTTVNYAHGTMCYMWL